MTKGLIIKPKTLDKHERRVKEMFQMGMSIKEVRDVLTREYRDDWKERCLYGKYR